MIKYLADEEELDVNVGDKYGSTPLHWAAKGGNLEVVKYLIDEKGVDFYVRNSYGSSPLHLAAAEGHLHIL